MGRWLGSDPLPQIGAISYGIYLYHMVVIDIVWALLLPDIETWNRSPKFGLRLAVFFGLTFLVAKLSHRFIEKPCLELKSRFRPTSQA